MKSLSKDYIKGFYLLKFFGHSSFDVCIWNLFFTQQRNLTISVATFAYSFVYLSIGLFDLITGVVADRFSRKNCALAGYLFRFAGAFSVLFFFNLTGLILANILTGIGWALLSGSIDALMFDKLKSNNLENNYSKIIANGISYLFLGRSISFFLSGFLYEINPNLPYIAVCICLIIPFIIIFYFTEGKINSFQTETKHSILISAFKNFKDNFYLIKFLLLFIFLASIAEINWVLFTPSLVNLNIQPKYIGIVYAFAAIFSALGSQSVKFLFKKDIRYSSSIVFSLLLAVSSCLMSLLTGHFWIILGIMIASFAFGLEQPIISANVNKYVESRYRATALSLVSTFGLILSFLFVSLGAYITNIVSVNIAFSCLSLAYLIAMLILILLNYKKILNLTKQY